MTNVRPLSIGELQDAVRAHERIAIVAGGSKSDAPAHESTLISMQGLSGIVDYSPDECVFSALAGTPLNDIAQTLEARGQCLPFDPPFGDEGATIGGTVASDVSGPGRYRYGGVRDFLIGVRIVDGEGRLIRSGGKVVKNAAGFLLHQGVVGSLGRFGVIAEVTFKVFPRPEARRTMSIDCGSVEGAFDMARRIEAMRRDCEAIDFDQRGTLTVRVAGRSSTVDARAEALARRVAATEVVERGRGSPAGTGIAGRGSIVKVAGLMNRWEKVRKHVAAAQFMCAGAVAWLTTDDLPGLSRALAEARLPGLVMRGRGAGHLVGHLPANEFDARVRRVLDPHGRFHGGQG